MAIDVNCDLGEGFGRWVISDDDSLMPLITSANIACGFHAGDPSIMSRVCESAVAHEVRIGAHVGYRDLVGFGRRSIPITPEALRNEILYQLGALNGIARAVGGAVRYVKPHGALYHTVATDAATAEAVTAAIRLFDPDVGLIGLGESALHGAAESTGITFQREGFVDRAYEGSGALVTRETDGAVLDTDDAVAQARDLVTTGCTRARDGSRVAVHPQTLCVHSDSPKAMETLQRVRELLAHQDTVAGDRR
jgi:5-oxoprolinase (ATP-hydrolysing) subunit A